MTTVLVTGATGTLGRAVVRLLLAGGHTPRALSRRVYIELPSGAELIAGDLAHGSGLAEALAGVDAIISCATDPKRANVTDVEGTRQLLEAARETAPHLIYPSIVGIDSSAYGYYRAKRATERLIEQGPLPWTILRATQFHDFVAWLVQSFRAGDEVIIPGGMRFQSVDVEEMAARLVAQIEAGPAERLADLGGPEVLTFDEIAATYLLRRGWSATIRATDLRSDLYDVFRSGVNLTPARAQGAVTWDAYLRRRFSVDAAER